MLSRHHILTHSARHDSRACVPFNSECRSLRTSGKSSVLHPFFVNINPNQHKIAMSVVTQVVQGTGNADTDNAALLEDRRSQVATMYAGYKDGFPEVRDISAAEVKVLLEQQVPLILVDVRTDEEQQVSMIAKATTKNSFEKEKEKYKNSAVITYCTAGARSGKYASQLGKEGFTDVRNMAGSLLSWTHEGLPLVAGDGSGAATKKVHAFGPKWAVLYAPGYETSTFPNPTLKGATEVFKGAVGRLFGSGK